MTTDAMPQQWTPGDLDGLTDRERQIFYWGVSVGYERCAETRDLSVVFNAGFFAAAQRQIDGLTPKPAGRKARPVHLSVVRS